MSSEKYVIDQDGGSEKPGTDQESGPGCCEQVKENFLTLGCEPVRPDKGNFIYVGVIVGLTVLAIIIGTFTGRGSIQGMQSSSLVVKSTNGEPVSMISLLTVFEVPQLYLPGGNFFNSANIEPPPYNITFGNVSVAPALSNTQTLQDFQSSWTVILDFGSSICYMQPFNSTAMGTYQEFSEALVQSGAYVLNTVTKTTETGWSVRKAALEEVNQLSSYVRERCKGQNKGIIRIVETGLPPLISGCVESFLPEYELRRNESDMNLVNLVNIKMIPKLDLKECPLDS